MKKMLVFGIILIAVGSFLSLSFLISGVYLGLIATILAIILGIILVASASKKFKKAKIAKAAAIQKQKRDTEEEKNKVEQRMKALKFVPEQNMSVQEIYDHINSSNLYKSIGKRYFVVNAITNAVKIIPSDQVEKNDYFHSFQTVDEVMYQEAKLKLEEQSKFNIEHGLEPVIIYQPYFETRAGYLEFKIIDGKVVELARNDVLTLHNILQITDPERAKKIYETLRDMYKRNSEKVNRDLANREILREMESIKRRLDE